MINYKIYVHSGMDLYKGRVLNDVNVLYHWAPSTVVEVGSVWSIPALYSEVSGSYLSFDIGSFALEIFKYFSAVSQGDDWEAVP
jgi:hypothetical protein